MCEARTTRPAPNLVAAGFNPDVLDAKPFASCIVEPRAPLFERHRGVEGHDGQLRQIVPALAAFFPAQ